jgi:hypothetical protein
MAKRATPRTGVGSGRGKIMDMRYSRA